MSVPHRSRDGFTLVELLVVIGIIAVLIAILLPALNRARASARVASCLSSARQVMLGITMYANDNDGYLPAGSDPADQTRHINGFGWVQRLIEGRYMSSSESANDLRRDVFICNADQVTRTSSGGLAFSAKYATSYKGILGFGWYNRTSGGTETMGSAVYQFIPVRLQNLPKFERYGAMKKTAVPILVESATINDNQFGITVPYATNHFREQSIKVSTPHPQSKRTVTYADGSAQHGLVVFKRNSAGTEIFYHPLSTASP